MTTEITAQTYLEQELKKFNITDASVEEIKNRYLPLKIQGADDKEGYKVINAARKHVKSIRVDIEKKRKEINSDALTFQRTVNEEAKRVTALIEPIEQWLEVQEVNYIKENERIEQERIEAENNKKLERTRKILSFGYVFDGVTFKAEFKNNDLYGNTISMIEQVQLLNLNNDEFNNFIKEIEKMHSIHIDIQKREQEEIAKLLREKQEREEKERQEIEQEKLRLQLEAERLQAMQEELKNQKLIIVDDVIKQLNLPKDINGNLIATIEKISLEEFKSRYPAVEKGSFEIERDDKCAHNIIAASMTITEKKLIEKTAALTDVPLYEISVPALIKDEISNINSDPKEIHRIEDSFMKLFNFVKRIAANDFTLEDDVSLEAEELLNEIGDITCTVKDGWKTY